MAEPTWGQLKKAQDDNQTIDEAIAAAIAAHETDPDAHTGAGESLETHKSQEVIDHLAGSVVTDKIKDHGITLLKRDWDKKFIESQFESIDGWEVDGEGTVIIHLGEIIIRSTGVDPAYVDIYILNADYPLNWSKNPFYQTQLLFPLNTSQIAYFGIGLKSSNSFAGFKVSNGTLYAYNTNGTPTQTEITGIDITALHIYRVVVTSGTKIEFYVDGVLKATHTTNLPTGTLDYNLNYYIESTIAAWREIKATVVVFYQD